MPTIRIDLSPEDHEFLMATARTFELGPPEQAAKRLLLRAMRELAKQVVEAADRNGGRPVPGRLAP